MIEKPLSELGPLVDIGGTSNTDFLKTCIESDCHVNGVAFSAKAPANTAENTLDATKDRAQNFLAAFNGPSPTFG